MAVHFGIHEPKRGGFVTGDGLIAREFARDLRFAFSASAVAQSRNNFSADAPIFVFSSFKVFHPKVRDGHGQSSVEADAVFANVSARVCIPETPSAKTSTLQVVGRSGR